MKKYKRWIAIALVFMLCLSLCGCQKLEDMRAVHATWQEDGTILWNGNVYRQIEDVPDTLQFYVEQEVLVTESDVPVLLSDILGTGFTVDKDGVLMHNWSWKGDETWFCREDKYEEMATYFQMEVEMDTYFYTYWPEENGRSKETHYYLSDEEKNAIDTLLNELDFDEPEDDFFNTFEMTEFCVTLGRCDGKHLFAEHYVVEIVSKQEGYYLFSDGLLARVPDSYYSLFEKIVADYFEWEVLPYLSE